jgi:hypothetical protein
LLIDENVNTIGSGVGIGWVKKPEEGSGQRSLRNDDSELKVAY